MAYFYIIQSLSTGEYYSGCRVSKDAHPSDLFVTYFTSSRQIHKRLSLGERFLVRKTIEFEVAELASDHERRFLKRVHAKSNPKFINNSETGATILDDDAKRKGQLRSSLTRFFKQNRHPKKLSEEDAKKRRKERREYWKQKTAEKA